MASIKRDDVKQSWEETEFPLVCETCLGDNPYIRMTKEPHGKKCKVCENPFTVFSWQAGTKGRMKRVEICKTCAQAKNVCQVCIYDLQYGLPVKVRDRILRETGSGGAATAVPQSNANRAWFTAQQKRAIEQGDEISSTTALAHAKLTEMARMEPAYERNLPKLCTFYARGECDRGVNCPFRHEMPRDRNDPMSKQSTKDRFFGQNDPVANKILGRKRRQEEEQTQSTDDYEKSRATAYLRFVGDAPYPELTEEDIRDQFYSFGEIVSVRAQSDKGQAFVEYTQPEAAELAIASMNRRELLGRPIFCAWARAPKRGESGDAIMSTTANTATTPVARPVLAAPPGGTKSTTTTTLPIPKISVKPPPEVAAMAAARRRQENNSNADLPPATKKPFYPSADPSRLGSKAT
jgi:pre-mRNA-splicing factor RBM22/SLT11